MTRQLIRDAAALSALGLLIWFCWRLQYPPALWP